MVVEDEPLIRQNIVKKIESLNLPLTLCAEVSDGSMAIESISALLPNLIITDIRMPQCDGLELARYIKENHPSIKTIILSGYHEFSYAQKAMRYHVCDYLLKPLKTDALQETLQQVLLSLDANMDKLGCLHVNAYDMPPEKICKLMLDYFQQHYKEDISISSLADTLGFSMEYLARIFKKETGLSPSKYLTSLRMNEAKLLLLSHASLEVGRIGEMVGYKDAFYFSRVFKSNVNMTPSEYRHETMQKLSNTT
jgi:two-component system response regulator YesN